MRFLKFISPMLAAAAFCASATAAEPVKIRMAYVVPVANWASILFEKPGLARHMGKSYTLEVTQYKGTPPQITALANNELDIADLAFSSLPLAVENAGMDDLRVIADEFQDGVDGYYSDEFFVLKDGPIKTVKDLKGKVVATNAAGSAVDIVMRAMLRKNGLDDRKDVSVVEAAFPNMYAMLSQKKVDAIPGVVPFSFNPKLREESRVLFTQKEAVGRTQMIVWVARAGFLQKHRAAMEDFMEDAIRAVHWWLDPKNHEEAVAIAARVSKRPAASFDSWLFLKKGQQGDYYRDPNLVPDLNALQANVDLQHQLGLLKTRFDVKSHTDLSIVEDAAKRVK
jgi:sulfonate transport system substrate-binding protein